MACWSRWPTERRRSATQSYGRPRLTALPPAGPRDGESGKRARRSGLRSLVGREAQARTTGEGDPCQQQTRHSVVWRAATAGHIEPALAVRRASSERHGATVTGGHRAGPGTRLSLPGVRTRYDQGRPGAQPGLLKLPFRVLKPCVRPEGSGTWKPTLIGFGGYVSHPVTCGRSLGIVFAMRPTPAKAGQNSARLGLVRFNAVALRMPGRSSASPSSRGARGHRAAAEAPAGSGGSSQSED